MVSNIVRGFLFVSFCFSVSECIAMDFERSGVDILVIGNSISRHRPSNAIGWNRDWGMAASSMESDYVHLFKYGLESRGYSVNLNILSGSAWERGLEPLDNLLKKIGSKSYDLVVVQLGDNSGARDGGFVSEYGKLLNELISRYNGVKLRCIGVWWKKKKLNSELRNSCEQLGGEYVDLEDVPFNEKYQGGTTYPELSKAVREHPGDLGMKVISDRLLQSTIGGN